jgi:hypothetical protein
MSETNKVTRAYGTIACPVCTQQIPLQPKEGNPHRVVAKHACHGQPYRTVLEKDAPDFPPPTLMDRMEQTEHTEETASLQTKKKKR